MSPSSADRAGAADALLAAGVRAGEPKLLAQEIGEMRARKNARLDRLAVDGERDVDRRGHAAPPASPGGGGREAPEGASG